MKRLLTILLLIALSLGLGSTIKAEITYPFLTDDTAFDNGVKIYGPTTNDDYWNFVEINFDNGNQNLQDLKYLVIQLRADKGAPGMTYGLIENGDRFTVAAAADHSPINFMDTSSNLGSGEVMYGAVSLPEHTEGALVIPYSSLAWQWNNNNSDLSNVKSLYLTTNSQYNSNWELTVGNIGYITNDDAYKPLRNLTNKLKTGQLYADLIGGGYTEKILSKTDYEYPFLVSESAFDNGVTWTGPDKKTGDDWNLLQIKFDDEKSVDLTNATHLVFQIRVDKGLPGVTYGLMENNDRFSTGAATSEDKPVFMVLTSGEVFPLANILYGSINIPTETVGALFIPIDSLDWQWNNEGSDLTNVTKAFLTTNSMHNFNYEITVGNVGYINELRKYVSLRNLDNIPYPGQYINIGSSVINVLDGEQVIDDIDINEYPFRTGKEAYKNGRLWAFPATASSSDDMQELTISFDNLENDLSNATYIAIQLNNQSGAPGLEYIISSELGKSTIATSDGKPVYQLKENKNVRKTSDILYGSATVSIRDGALLIPITTFKGNADLTKLSSLSIKTNRRYNYNFELIIGEIGYFTGELGVDESYYPLFELDVDKTSHYTVKGDKTNDTVLRTLEQTTYGDVKLDFLATGKTALSFPIWTGGSFADLTMVKDSYNDDALEITPSGNNPSGDAYVAVTIADQTNFNWSNLEGVTLWARNDSDREISFNLEVDNKVGGVSDRFNISQGNRYYLYDVNSGKTFIYMTKPTINLPVGFEGWVRVPFAAFNRAAWSNNGVTKEQFMSDGSTVTYLAVTIHAANYLNLSFSLNKIGGYGSDPTFVSDFIKSDDNKKSIDKLMELD